eukprot:snap_masked-scaffold_6-processed-gene-4.21-mRNA-1 protein AED:1.00 eAED:1.00 QI:0/0/0/0/1/1/2/0/248
MLNSTFQESKACFLFSQGTSATNGNLNLDAYDWGSCCDDLSIVPKPLWLVLLFSLPIEAVLAGADIRATGSMYAKKENRTAALFVFFNIATLATIAYEFPWEQCSNELSAFDCYQGLVFMFYNSTAALATLTVWMLIVLRKFYVQMFLLTKNIIFHDRLWKKYFEIKIGELEVKKGADDTVVEAFHEPLIAEWKEIGDQTSFYWYDFLLIGVNLVFGGLTHVFVGNVFFRSCLFSFTQTAVYFSFQKR